MVGSNSDWEFQVKSQIKRRYARQALEDNFRPNSATRMKELGYSQDMISLLPDELQGAFSGCGCPISDLTFAGNEVVIDLGCGAGIDGFIASKLVPRGVVISVDFTFEMLKILQNHAQGTPVNVLASDVESLPLRSEIADYAISNAVFNLTPNKDMAYREMHRILKPRGR
ncbi:MAG: methyltransferase domain-containing protein, partial [Rhodospirillales bacterium]|nr:methyltransferase domain-containing protein [Rhodospirillales bacterium]